MPFPKDPVKAAAVRKKLSAKGKARAATPEGHDRLLDMTAQRLLKFDKIRQAGGSNDYLSSEKRSEVGRAAGKGSAAARAARGEDTGAVLTARRQAHSDILTARTIKLPRTARRSDPQAFIRLVKRVCRERTVCGGWAFEGPTFKSGAVVNRGQLWPDRDFPTVPVLLECAGRVEGRRGVVKWILWRLGKAGRWDQLATAEASDASWAAQIGDAAARALLPPAAPIEQDEYTVDVAQFAAMVHSKVSGLIAKIRHRRTRAAVWALYHDLVTATVAQEQEDGPAIVIEPAEE